MEKVIRAALDILLCLLLKNTLYLTQKCCTRCSPPPPFYFHGQLSQPHCYLAPPESPTAFNPEQWLTEHMLWDLEGSPPKSQFPEFQDDKAGRCTPSRTTSLLQRGSPHYKRDMAAPASTLLEVSRAIAPARVAGSPRATGHLTLRRSHIAKSKRTQISRQCTLFLWSVFLL